MRKKENSRLSASFGLSNWKEEVAINCDEEGKGFWEDIRSLEVSPQIKRLKESSLFHKP